MRVKVRFDGEAGQSPMVLDVRFLPRRGERIELGYQRVIEVIEVRCSENDNRYGGIVRARHIRLERDIGPRPVLRPLPSPSIPGLSVSPIPPAMAPAPVTSTVVTQENFEPEPTPAPANYGSVTIDQLLASFHGGTIPQPLGNQ